MNRLSSLTYRMAALTASLLLTTALQANAQSPNVWTQHNDNNRDGVYSAETTLTPSNVNSTNFGKLFTEPVDDQVFAQPLVINGVSIAGGTHKVLYVATTNNSVYAFDADTGVQ
ncbi:MAG TPA: PQQ-binding-like beta-propeller repeat protein, partial [Acidobacteriaceae bacterium]|nr:PQQ-binding-like beta-propeller repeat protein [Acidobacteriaceae bacterium]